MKYNLADRTGHLRPCPEGLGGPQPPGPRGGLGRGPGAALGPLRAWASPKAAPWPHRVAQAARPLGGPGGGGGAG